MHAILDSPIVYFGILIAAMVEGEVAYVAASALVAHGRLSSVGVIMAGATGAAIGDQFYFYLLRGRLTRWMTRIPALHRRAAPLVGRVKRHDSAMVLLIRFAPGLRVTLAAACAYAGVSAVKFSVLDSVSAVIWALTVMGLVVWVGPTGFAMIGLSGWKAAALSGAIVVALIYLAGRFERRALAPEADHGTLGTAG
jgi:membrane protein DedA with SNARE-associated domain